MRLKSSRSMYTNATPHAPIGLSLGEREGVGPTVQEERPVGQAGQGIMEGLMDGLLLDRLALGEVLEHKPHLQ